MNSKKIRDYKCSVNNDEISLGEVISSNKKRYTELILSLNRCQDYLRIIKI